MIRGAVVGLQAQVGITLRLPNSPDIELTFVVDTGFEGALTLPPAAIAALGLPYFGDLNANLADDSNTRVDVHIATIVWEGVERDVAVLAMGKRPLLGTALLSGNYLGINFNNGGDVHIEPRP